MRQEKNISALADFYSGVIDMGKEKIKEKLFDEIKFFEKGIKIGKIQGASEEGKKSIIKRFTDAELNAIIEIVWVSDLMQSIRNKQYCLIKRIEALEEEKKE